MDGKAPGVGVDEIYSAALEHDDTAARAAYLDEACGRASELRQRVERLLVAREERGSFLEGPAAGPTIGIDSIGSECTGATIGPYKLLEAIGEGGMGTVYMAEQSHPVRRRVALKLIKPGMDSKQVVARFEAERQALALMDHPNIARVLDAGTVGEGERGEGSGVRERQKSDLTPDPSPLSPSLGRPYFVMELVRGLPITEYCDRHLLSIAERLDLFVLVCRAVQHAHQKGVIHRDLKPSNVLVTVIDGAAVPKIIDFGVAKAVGQALTDKTLFTGFHQFVGTPLYVSPEQAELSGVDVDTRSDIYSLGVLLYELLTGTTPFDSETLKRAAFDEMRRIIREEEPQKPSTRLSTLGEQLSTVSASRKSDPRRLAPSLKGELDWIVMKALEKDRRRRYETAGDFAADVMRYRGDQPVQACPPSAAYRFRKFATRNKGVLTTLCVVAAALVVGIVVSAWQAVRATRAEARARAEESKSRAAANAEREAKLAEARQRELTASNLDHALHALHRTYLRVAEHLPEEAEPSAYERELLEEILAFYEEFTQGNAGDPAMQAELASVYYRIGAVYDELGRRSESVTALRKSVALGREVVRHPPALEPNAPSDWVDLNTCIDLLGLVLMADPAGVPEAQALFRECVQDLERQSAESQGADPVVSADLARSVVHLGATLKESGQVDQAMREYQRAEQLFRQLVAGPTSNANLRSNLATVLNKRAELLKDQEPDAALRCMEEAITYQQAALAESPRDVNYRAKLGRWLQQLGHVQERLGNRDAAEQSYVQAAAALEAVVADAPGAVAHRGDLANVLSWLGSIRANEGRPEEAEAAFRRCVELNQKLVDRFPDEAGYLSELALNLYNLGNVLAWTKRGAEAEESWRASIELSRKCMEKFSGRGTDTLVSSLTNLGTLRDQLDQHDEAEVLYQEAVTTGRALVARAPGEPRNSHLLGVALHNLSEQQYDRDEIAGAIRLMDEAIARQELAFKSMAWYPMCGEMLADHYGTLAEWLANARDPQHRDPLRAVELARKALKVAPDSRDGHVTLGVALYRAGDARAAIAEMKRGLDLDKTEGAPTATTWFFISMAHSQLEERDEARQWYDRAVAWMDMNPEHKERLSRWRAEAAERLGIEDSSISEQASPPKSEGTG